MAASGGDPLIAWGWLTVGLARTAGCMAQQRAETAHRELAACMNPAQLACAVRTLGLSVQHHVARIAPGATVSSSRMQQPALELPGLPPESGPARQLPSP